MTPTLLDAIDVSEKVDLGFPFAGEMEAGETISSFTVAIKVKAGTDALVQQVLSGSPVIPTGTFEVIQRVQGHVGNVIYRFKCSATLSSGRILTKFYDLPVTDYFA